MARLSRGILWACTIMVGLWGVSASAAETVKVGVIDQQIIMERTKAGKSALEDVKSYSMTRQKIINADEQELKELEQTLQDPNNKLGDAARQEKQGQMQSKVEAYQRRVQEFNREVQQKQREMVVEYSRKIAAATQAVAQREGYTAILDKGNEALLRIILYYQPSLDITDLVAKEFDQQNP